MRSSPSRPLVAAPLVLLVVALFPGALANYRGGQPWAAGCGYTGKPTCPGWAWADQISLPLVNYVPKTGVTPTGAFTLVYYANTDSVATRTSPQVTAENQCTTTGCTAENQCYRGTTTGTTTLAARGGAAGCSPAHPTKQDATESPGGIFTPASGMRVNRANGCFFISLGLHL